MCVCVYMCTQAHLVDSREVLLRGLDVVGGGATCHLQHPCRGVVAPLDRGHPLKSQHAKVCQLHKPIYPLSSPNITVVAVRFFLAWLPMPLFLFLHVQCHLSPLNLYPVVVDRLMLW